MLFNLQNQAIFINLLLFTSNNDITFNVESFRSNKIKYKNKNVSTKERKRRDIEREREGEREKEKKKRRKNGSHLIFPNIENDR